MRKRLTRRLKAFAALSSPCHFVAALMRSRPMEKAFKAANAAKTWTIGSLTTVEPHAKIS